MMTKLVSTVTKPTEKPETFLDLPPDEFLSQWYERHYESNAYSGVAARIQHWMHASIEFHHGAGTYFESVLELGGNLGEHLPFVKHQFSEYFLTDLNIPKKFERGELRLPDRITWEQADIQKLSYPSNTFDRVLHMCLLHHVPEVEAALQEIRRVLKPNGVADLFVSSDPGLVFRMGRELGPVKSARREGLLEVKRLVDARDHRNSAGRIIRLIEHTFRKDELRRRTFPFNIPSWNLSLWTTFRIRAIK